LYLLKEASLCQNYIVDQRSDHPLQYRAIGWSRGDLYSVIFELRSNALGEYFI